MMDAFASSMNSSIPWKNKVLLNADDDCQLWCLHFVFLPIINRHLSNGFTIHYVKKETKRPCSYGLVDGKRHGDFMVLRVKCS